MLTLNFQTPKEFEDKISHNQEIVFLKILGFYGTATELAQGNVELFWEEQNHEGYQTGTTFCFNPETESLHRIGDITNNDDNNITVLKWMVNGMLSDDIAFVMDSNDYFNAIEKAQESSK